MIKSNMDTKQKNAIRLFTRQCLEYFSSNRKLNIPVYKEKYFDLINKGLFISLYCGDIQRACMGVVKFNSNLAKMIIKVSELVCLKDDRYSKIEQHELAELTITIWIINNFYEFKTLDDLIIGKHGLYIISDSYSALYLPYIAVKNNWSPEEFIMETCKKAECPHDWNKIKNNILLFDATRVDLNE